MLQSIPPFTDFSASLRKAAVTSALEFSAPSKVFLLGEYAVLAGLPALVAAIGPRFRLKAAPRSSAGASAALGAFHPQSPIGRLIAWAERLGLPELDFDFQDPFEGAGGFGASTAQFALAYRAYAEAAGWPLEWEKVWKLYRELTAAKEGLSPSGADLIAQWQGGITLFGPRSEGTGYYSENLRPDFNGSGILVFSATFGMGTSGRKIATHQHLGRLEPGNRLVHLGKLLAEPLQDGISAIRGNNPQALGDAINRYAEILRSEGLEVPHTTEDRRVLGALPGVLGVKGAGAMQSDALVVVMDPNAGANGAPSRSRVIDRARSRNLFLVSDGLDDQKGVSCLL